MNNQRQILLSTLLLLSINGLQLPNTSIHCYSCKCRPDPQYGGTLADCSNRGFFNVYLPIPNVTTLIFDHNKLDTLSASQFEGFSNLRHLELWENQIIQIEKPPKVILTRLEYLDLSRNIHLGFNEVANLIFWVSNTTIKTLVLNYVVTLKTVITPLTGIYCSFLQHTPLTKISLDGNAFSYFGKSCLSTFPKTIEIISIRYTMLGDFDIANFTGLIQLTSLKEIDTTGFTTWNPGNGHSTPWHKSVIQSVIIIMPSLEVFRCRAIFLRADVGRITILPPNNNMTTMDISQNLLTSVTGPFTGLGHVSHVDISQNTITSISQVAFQGLNRLKVFNASNNMLRQCVEADTSGDLLKETTHLEVLDLSNNGITFLPKRFFQWSLNVRNLIISGNLLSTFDADIVQMGNLRELDLRNNKLNQLPKEVTEQLNRLPLLKIVIDSNPLSCSCDTLDFLEWMQDNRHVEEIDKLKCTQTNGSTIELKHLDVILSSLKKTCKSDVVVIFSSISGAFVLLLFVSGIMVYRHRWKLRYLYYVGRNKYQLIPNEEDVDECRFDAFISYAETDRTFVIKTLLEELEDKSGLQLCIHHRDFLPGDIITENIINAIQMSRKTVIILTPAFLKSEWCIYEFHMARLDGITRKLNNILVILLEDVDFKQLPKDLAMLMTKNSYLEYSNDQYGEAVFWTNLTNGIKTIKHRE